MPGQMAEVASGAKGVAFDELITSEPIGGRGAKQAVGAADLPIGERHAEVDERVADGAHFPIEDGLDAGGVEGEEEIIELVVVVDDGGRALGRKRRLEVGNDFVEFGEGFGAGLLPAASPAVDLAGEEAGGLAKVEEAGRGEVDGVKFDEGVDEGFAEGPRGGGDFGGVAVEASEAALHQVEGDADDGWVLTAVEDAGGGREDGSESGQDAILAGHVMGFGRQRTERGPAEDAFAAGCAKEVGEVRVAAGELPDFERTIEAR